MSTQSLYTRHDFFFSERQAGNLYSHKSLSITGESFIGKRGHVVGWGVTSFPMGEPSPTLQKLEVKVLSNARCSTVIEESIGIGMLCAAPDETQGTCFVSEFFTFLTL
jgi:Trypsin.